jgi:mono/diheme cytochrome c family protein
MSIPAFAWRRLRRAASLTALASLSALLICHGALAENARYIGWTRNSTAAPTGSPRGLVEYQNSCVACHGPMPGHPGTRALAAKYSGRLPVLLEERTDLSPELIRAAVRHGMNVMPPLRKTEVSDADLDAIVAYLTRARR